MIQNNTESQLHTNTSGRLSKKLDELKRIVTEEISGAAQSSQQNSIIRHQQTVPARPIEITACLRSCNHSQQALSQQVPIILEKQRTNGSRKTKKQSFEGTKIQSINQMAPPSRQYSSNRLKHAQPFQPIDIPLRERKIESNIQPTIDKKPKTTEIQIHIEKSDNDEKNKDCLKKLFKKVNKLTGELNESQKERNRLILQLEFMQKHEKRDADMDKTFRDTQNERHRLKLEVATLKEQLASEKAKPPQVIEKIVNQLVEVIRQVPVEKIVEVRIQVPKHIPGPERIVQRKVEVPQVIEVQKKVPVEIIKEVIKEVPRQIIKTVEIPSYIEKPIYVDRIVEKEVRVPVQVPVEVPVFIDRPVFQSRPRDTAMEEEIKLLLTNISTLESQLSAAHHTISQQHLQIDQLYRNIEILRRHNEDKNKEVQALIQNSFDQYNSHDVIRLRGGLLGSPVPSGYYSNNYTISSDSIPPLGARPRFI